MGRVYSESAFFSSTHESRYANLLLIVSHQIQNRLPESTRTHVSRLPLNCCPELATSCQPPPDNHTVVFPMIGLSTHLKAEYLSLPNCDMQTDTQTVPTQCLRMRDPAP